MHHFCLTCVDIFSRQVGFTIYFISLCCVYYIFLYQEFCWWKETLDHLHTWWFVRRSHRTHKSSSTSVLWFFKDNTLEVLSTREAHLSRGVRGFIGIRNISMQCLHVCFQVFSLQPPALSHSMLPISRAGNRQSTEITRVAWIVWSCCYCMVQSLRHVKTTSGRILELRTYLWSCRQWLILHTALVWICRVECPQCFELIPLPKVIILGVGKFITFL